MKYIFIINEIAGKGKAKKIQPNIEKACKERKLEYEIRYISKEKSGYDIAMEYKEKVEILLKEYDTSNNIVNEEVEELRNISNEEEEQLKEIKKEGLVYEKNFKNYNNNVFGKFHTTISIKLYY